MIQLTLDWPPSSNRYWRKWQGRIVKSTEARNYQEQAGWMAKAAGLRETMTGKVALSVRLYRPQKRGDLDNRLKVLLDSLNGILYEDDAQIRELHAYLGDDKANPRVEIEAWQVGGA